jgi:hypothetical protein
LCLKLQSEYFLYISRTLSPRCTNFFWRKLNQSQKLD